MKKELFPIILASLFVIYGCGKSVDSGYDKSFSVDYIPVEMDGKNMYVDWDGNVLIDDTLSWAVLLDEPFFNGVTKVYGYTHKKKMAFGFIDKKGNMVFEPQFERVGDFCESLIWTLSDEGELQATDITGKTVFVKKDISAASPFRNGVSIVTIEGQTKGQRTRYGTVNEKGEMEIVPTAKWDKISDFSNGYAYVVDQSDKYGVINKKGELVVPCQFSYIGEFEANGLAVVVSESRKYGVINAQGEVLIEPTIYDDLIPDGDQFIFVKDGKSGVIDKTGKVLLDTDYKMIAFFKKNDLAPAYNGKSWGFINKKGEQKIPFQYELATSFINNRAIVRVDNKYGIIDTKGNFIVTPRYDDVSVDYIRMLMIGRR